MRLVLSTCDAFCFVLPLFFEHWERAMHADHMHWFQEVMVLANTKPVAGPDSWCKNFSVHYTGVDEGWSNNMLKFLDNHYPDNKPFLLMLDDYIVQGFDASLITDCVNAIEVYDNVGMVRLVPIPGPTMEWHDLNGRNKRIGRLDKKTHESYCLSLQAAMWKPKVLRGLLRHDENPWQTESRGSRRAAQAQGAFLCCREPAVTYLNYLKRGKVREEAVETLKAQEVCNAQAEKG